MLFRPLAWLILALSFLLLAACFPRGNAGVPIPHLLVTAPAPASRLVVVLPGRGDDLAAMRRSGMAEAIQSAWPDADVILTGLSYDYYMQGRAPQRLHDEIVAPARHKAYRQSGWQGPSMGGMGTLMYDRAYPGEMSGLLLLAPYLGETSLLKEIDAAGGVAQWQPGPVPPPSPPTISSANSGATCRAGRGNRARLPTFGSPTATRIASGTQCLC